MQYKNTTGINYPNRSDEQMTNIKKVREVKIDENYPFYDKSIRYKINRVLGWIVANIFYYPRVTLNGGKILGIKNLKKNKNLFKDGAITVCNHVLYWDYVLILKAIRPKIQYHPSWKENFQGKYGRLIKLAGGIPIPTDNKKAMAKWNKALGEILAEGKWMHFFPEGALWPYYPDIRPLKKGVFKLAVRYNKPIIPMAISFRERTGIFKLTGKRPLPTLHIGEPILPDLTLPLNERIDKLHKETYHVMQGLIGIYPGDPRYNTNQDINTWTKR